MTRRELLQAAIIAPVVSLHLEAASSRSRALIVGINNYHASITPAAVPAVSRVSATGGTARIGWDNLRGAVNDARAMRELLTTWFGFPSTEVVYLEDGQATADRILGEFKRHLIDRSAPGDAAVFFYAGHGSRIRNTASDEIDGMDETIVPADSAKGTLDIRDKELARLYRAAAEKGVVLTVILDCCHAGGLARGNWNQLGRFRALPADGRTVNDPPDKDPTTGRPLPDPADVGVLVLTGAGEDEPARELDENPDHGVFTTALLQALRSSPQQPVERIFEQVRGIVRGGGYSQQPQMQGAQRFSQTLFGHIPGLSPRPSYAVEKAGLSGDVAVRGGPVTGLGPGCTLTRAVREGGDPEATITLEITQSTGPASSLARRTSPGRIHPGDVYFLERWVTPVERRLRVFLPTQVAADAAIIHAGMVIDQLQRTGEVVLSSDQLAKPEVDVHLTPPTHVLSWSSGAWMIERYDHPVAPVRLDAELTVSALRAALGTGVKRLLPMLPPTASVAQGIKTSAGTENGGIELAASPARATFLLAGRWTTEGLSYTWMHKDCFRLSVADCPLPRLTAYCSTPEELNEKIERLSRIQGWLTIESPPGGDSNFPYRLTFERAGVNAPLPAGAEVHPGEQCVAVLRADSQLLNRLKATGRLSRRYVYVFGIFSDGSAKLLFGSLGSALPQSMGAVPERIELPHSTIKVEPPQGRDNYFLVSTSEPLNGDFLNWNGVIRYGEKGVAPPPSGLTRLLSSVGTGQRGGSPVLTPASWFIDRYHLITRI